MKYNHKIQLVDGVEIRNLKISTSVDQALTGVFKAVLDENSSEVIDIQVCSNGTDWFSLRGYKAENLASEAEGRVPIYEGLSPDGKKLQFRVLKAGKLAEEEYPALSISNTSGVISIDLSSGFKGKIDNIVSDIEDKVDKVDGKGLSTKDFTDAFYAKLNTIQIKKNTDGSGKYQLVFNDGTADIQLGESIPLDSVIKSGYVKECTVANEPVDGYEVGNKYLDLEIANSSEHIYILVTDLVDAMEGFEGSEITTTVVGSTIKASLNDASIDIDKLKKIVLGTYYMDNLLISDTNEYTIKDALIKFAGNIKDIYDKKANTLQTIVEPEGSSTQYGAGDYTINELIQKALNNIKYLFDNKANSDHSHEGYLKPTDVIDNITDSSTIKPLSAKQGKVLGGLINERIKGVKVDGAELTPDANKIVDIPTMVGATASVSGKVGLVPKPLSGQQGTFLRGDGTYGLPNADVVASASYVGGSNPVLEGMTSCQSVVGGNVEILLENSYVAREAFAGAVDIVRVMRNGLDLAEGQDFLIEEGIGLARKKITLIDYPLHTDDDIILVRYKTSIGVYGSVFQETIDNAIQVTNDAIDAAQRAEDAAIDAETIADSKIDKTTIKQALGTSSTDVMSQKAVTDSISQILQLEGEELWAYGVRWTQGQSPATLERIGNLNMHKTLPCHKTRGCLVLDDGTINYYLHDSTDFLKEDGVTPSVLDGTDGDVMNQRKFYYRTAIKDNVHVNWMSPYPLPGYTLYENLTGRYKASINRTTGKIHSVINNSPQFRGGNNTSAWDSDGRSLLGCAVSSISRVTLRSGARINRAVECNGTPEHDDFFARLIYARVKWATHNFQLDFNPALDANGYHQGGFGAGTTNLNSTKWNGYIGYCPFIPCGYTAEFGNGSGVKDFVMPFEYDGYNTTLSQQKYVGVYDSERIYATGEYLSDSLDTYKGSGDALLYLCILDAPEGTSLTNTTYFSLVNRTVTQAIRMDGEEQWFGEVWEHYANVIIEHNADVEPKTSKAYIFNNPSQIAETRTGNEEFLCDLPISDGYIKEFNAGSIFPISTGGGSTTYGCDYYSCNFPASGIATRGCLGGGLANNGSNAGPSYSYSNTSPSPSYASIGGRLVRKSKNRVIID